MFQPVVVRGPALVGAIEELGVAFECLQGGIPRRAEFDFGVHSTDTVGSNQTWIDGAFCLSRYRVQFAVGIDHSNRRLLSDVVIHAQNSEIRLVPGQRIIRSYTLAGRLVV